MNFSSVKETSKERSSTRVKASLALLLGLGAATLLSAGCASSNATASMRNSQGVESFSSGRYDDAISYFRESLDENPDNAETYYNLASAYQRKAAETGDTVLLGQAEDAYWTALEHDPKADTIVCCYRGLATSAMARGDSEGALQTLEAWRDRNPESIEPKLEIAYLLEAQQKDAEAYELLKEISEAAPDDYRAYYKMGVLSERAGDLSDAVENAKVARQLNPTDMTVAQRATSFEKQFAAQQKNGGSSEPESSAEASVATAEFADLPLGDDSTVQTTAVQTTAAQSQENEIPQIEMSLPADDPSGIPTSSYRAVPSVSPTTQDPNASLGFGVATATDSNGAVITEEAPVASTVDRKVRDDSDVKWISSANADRVRQTIAQTSATLPAASNSGTGFAHTTSDGTGASTRVPGSKVTTAQFETPSFVAQTQTQAQTTPTAAGTQQATGALSPNVQTPAPAQAATMLPSVSTEQSASLSQVPNAADLIPTNTAFGANAPQRSNLRVGPPRLEAGSFF